jgi:hypothetical protein
MDQEATKTAKVRRSTERNVRVVGFLLIIGAFVSGFWAAILGVATPGEYGNPMVMVLVVDAVLRAGLAIGLWYHAEGARSGTVTYLILWLIVRAYFAFQEALAQHERGSFPWALVNYLITCAVALYIIKVLTDPPTRELLSLSETPKT